MNDLFLNEIEKLTCADLPGGFPTPINPVTLPFSSHKNIFLKEEFKADAFGSGNKTRKLNFIIREAKEQKAKLLIADGIVSSNTCLAVSIACKMYSLKSKFILFGPEGEGFTDTFRHLGSRVQRFDHWSAQLLDDTRNQAVREAVAQGEKPYVVETGGSSPAGVLGSIHLAREIRKQEDKLKTCFDVIAFPNGTGGTAAGLHIFNELFNQSRWKLAPISIANSNQIFKTKFDQLWTDFSVSRNIAKTLNPYESFDIPEYLNYNELFKNWKENQECLLAKTSYYFDSIYNLKGILGLRQYMAQANLASDSKVLYILTGGYNEIYRPQKNRLQL